MLPSTATTARPRPAILGFLAEKYPARKAPVLDFKTRAAANGDARPDGPVRFDEDESDIGLLDVQNDDVPYDGPVYHGAAAAPAGSLKYLQSQAAAAARDEVRIGKALAAAREKATKAHAKARKYEQIAATADGAMKVTATGNLDEARTLAAAANAEVTRLQGLFNAAATAKTTAQTSASAAAAQAVQPKKADLSLAAQFTKDCLKQNDQAAGEDRCFYHWKSPVWVMEKREVSIQKAAAWLMSTDPEKYDAKMTRSLLESALDLMTSERPMKTVDDDVSRIQLLDAVLEVNEADGRVLVGEPHKRFGHTWAAKIQLNKAKVRDGVYTPTMPDPNTLFGDYFYKVNPTPERALFFAEAFGVTFDYNPVRHSISLWCSGPGGNGKSVWIDLLSAIHRSVKSIDMAGLDNRFVFAPIQGASLIVAAEVKKIGDAYKYKALVSGDQLPLEKKGVDADGEWRNKAMLVMTMNGSPRFDDLSDGMKRRIVPVPFLHSFMNEGHDPDFLRKILNNPAELEQVLDVCLIGLAEVYKRGRFRLPHEMPVETQKAMKAILADNDPTETWISEFEVSTSQKQVTLVRDIYNHYSRTLKEWGDTPLGSTAFWTYMHKRFPEGSRRAQVGKNKESAKGIVVNGVAAIDR